VLTPHEIDALFAPLAGYDRLGLAVSGGGDSMALMLLAGEWVSRAKAAPGLVVLTVDHRLRPESRQEAEWVAKQAAHAGVAHQSLTWTHDQHSASQADARNARYALMTAMARACGIGAIVTAHTSDDVAETFLMRLARGSGVDGLSAISAAAEWDGVPVLRPLIGVTRAQLRAELEARGATWLEDPSNAEERYERVRVRQALATLTELGIPQERIVESAQRLKRARAAIDEAAGVFIDNQVEVNPAGYARVAPDALRALPQEVAIHALKRLLNAVGGGRAPRLRKLEMLAAQFFDGLNAATTLGGCVISPAPGGIVFCREPGRLSAAPTTLCSGETVIWDARFRISCADLPRPVEVAALGEQNLAAVPEEVRETHPAPALATLPALYADGHLLGVPVRGMALIEQHADVAACTGTFIGWLDSTEAA
jgi:tRNA(Ile)-lysidine synthase